MISYIIYDIISYIIYYICSLVGTDIPPTQRVDAIDDGKSNPDLVMDHNEERDFADQGPLNYMEFRKGTQYSSQGARYYPLWLVLELLSPGP